MKNLIGLAVFVIGIILAIWLGVFVCCIGGIIQIIKAVKHTPVEAIGVVVGLVRFFLSSFIGWGIFWITAFITKIISE